MSEFVVPCASGEGALTFFERTPTDRNLPLERFKVRLERRDLSAVVRVYAGENADHPAALFSRMSAHWRGWPEALTWTSLEHELGLSCTQDRAGHVAIGVTIRSGPTETDWSVWATVMSEAGQLESLAHEAARFFGRDA